MFFLLFLAQLASAHFTINYPGSRGFDEDKQNQWPCGGFNDISSERSKFPLRGGPIQIHSSHPQQLLEVLMAVGNDPGSNFTVVVVPTVRETGPGDFCFGDLTIPGNLNISEGTNATLQVISGGGDEGGLYGCVDVMFTSTPLDADEYSQHCKNSTKVATAPLTESESFANGTRVSSSGGIVSNGENSATASAAAPSSTSAVGQVRVTIISWIFVALSMFIGLPVC